MRYLLTNCTIYTSTSVLRNHAVLVNDTLIEAVLPAVETPAEVPRHDCHGGILAPGFIDLQLYGGGGGFFSTDPSPAALARIRAHTLRHGTTSFLPTMPTNSPAMMTAAVAAVRKAMLSMPGLLGLHLEGPYINPIKKGAHQEEFIQQPTVAGVTELLAEAKGVLRIMTLAPEVASPEITSLLRAAGVIISAGHSNATYEQGSAAFHQGLTAATHLFNAMSQLGSREPGLVGAIYDAEMARASIIADGVHCAFSAVRISKKILGERLFLITDAVDESKEGAYRFHRQDNYFVDEQGILAGSALTMPDAVRNCVEQVGIPLAESLRMASLYPAQAIGLDDDLGQIHPGYVADLCLLNDKFEVQATVLKGELQWYS
ncbi:N-acetylglucosamine-6-phosphate deacetylase [Hymenobacter sp. GOD-10R]|uniref:N-acetylglucosamine-6-phosphate deacetylase n=1 Tax=Hymenobacter sp. GOD-10R TaxID=3093922 RepID=UPI002D79D8E6|nr:N-acetylglucosamine-6-phosphate deacetylase [Hymenobacter sp. GOD-10R]WRQ28384.1 N-acetylglucosamine-6-phosphate deacetylase [Hymenobacter sp. GOD-10R]